MTNKKKLKPSEEIGDWIAGDNTDIGIYLRGSVVVNTLVILSLLIILLIMHLFS